MIDLTAGESQAHYCSAHAVDLKNDFSCTSHPFLQGRGLSRV